MNQNLPLFAVTRHIAMVRLARPRPSWWYDVFPNAWHPSRRWSGCRVYTPLTSGVPAPATVTVSMRRRPDLPARPADEGAEVRSGDDGTLVLPAPPGVDDVQPGDRPGDRDWTLVRFALPSDDGGGVRSGVGGACGGRGALLALETVVEGSSGLETSPPFTLTLGAGTLADVLSSGVDPAPLGTTSHRFPPDWADGALL